MNRNPLDRPALVGAAGQIDRLLRLVPLLHGRDQVQISEAASLLQTTPAQVVKDLKVLLMCGLPGGYPDDLIDVDLDALEGDGSDGVIRVSNADYLARPLRLTTVEAAALGVALRSIGAGDPSSAEVVERTLRKLDLAAGEELARVQVREEPDLSQAWASALRGAMEADRRVRLEYWVPSRDELTHREVDPHRLDTDGGVTYLRGWCHTADAERSFRLDRVLGVRVLEDRRTHAEAAVQREHEATTVELLLAPEGGWITHYYATAGHEVLPDGRVRVRLEVWEPAWLDRFLLRLAPHVLDVQPPELADRFARTTQGVLGLYASH